MKRPLLNAKTTRPPPLTHDQTSDTSAESASPTVTLQELADNIQHYHEKYLAPHKQAINQPQLVRQPASTSPPIQQEPTTQVNGNLEEKEQNPQEVTDSATTAAMTTESGVSTKDGVIEHGNHETKSSIDFENLTIETMENHLVS